MKFALRWIWIGFVFGLSAFLAFVIGADVVQHLARFYGWQIVRGLW